LNHKEHEEHKGEEPVDYAPIPEEDEELARRVIGAAIGVRGSDGRFIIGDGTFSAATVASNSNCTKHEMAVTWEFHPCPPPPATHTGDLVRILVRVKS
jgi:hypothetical protein